MAETPTDVLVAGYQDIDEATKDFESLVALVKEKQVSIEGVILVTHAEDGSVAVRQTGDNRGRKGTGWGGGVGLAVGLFAPPLLASVAVGAVAGGVVGKFVDHRVENEHPRQDRREPAAGVGRDHRDLRRRAAARCRAGARGRPAPFGRPGRQEGHRRPEGVARRGDGEVQPGPDGAADPRSELRRHDRAERIDASVADWTINMTPSPPEGAPNVLLVLIDDAGFGNPSTFGGPVDDAGDDAGRRAGPQVQQFSRHRALLAYACRPADGPQPSHRRLWVDRRVPRPVPRLLRERAEGLRAVRPGAPGERLLDRRVRQVAPDPRSRPGGSRVRSTAGRTRGGSTASGASSAARRASTTP